MRRVLESYSGGPAVIAEGESLMLAATAESSSGALLPANFAPTMLELEDGPVAVGGRVPDQVSRVELRAADEAVKVFRSRGIWLAVSSASVLELRLILPSGITSHRRVFKPDELEVTGRAFTRFEGGPPLRGARLVFAMLRALVRALVRGI